MGQEDCLKIQIELTASLMNTSFVEGKGPWPDPSDRLRPPHQQNLVTLDLLIITGQPLVHSELPA
jgi:hypothetical protein